MPSSPSPGPLLLRVVLALDAVLFFALPALVMPLCVLLGAVPAGVAAPQTPVHSARATPFLPPFTRIDAAVLALLVGLRGTYCAACAPVLAAEPGRLLRVAASLAQQGLLLGGVGVCWLAGGMAGRPAAQGPAEPVGAAAEMPTPTAAEMPAAHSMELVNALLFAGVSHLVGFAVSERIGNRLRAGPR
jgi:hypothetical protein